MEKFNLTILSLQAFAYLKSTVETPEQSVKSVQSQFYSTTTTTTTTTTTATTTTKKWNTEVS